MKLLNSDKLENFLDKDFSIIIDFKINTIKREQTIVSWRKENDLDCNLGFRIFSNKNGKVFAGFGDCLGFKTFIESFLFLEEEANYNLIWTYNSINQALELWLNGKFSGLNYKIDELIKGDYLHFGCDPYFPSCDLDGEITSVEILDRVLTKEEIESYI